MSKRNKREKKKPKLRPRAEARRKEEEEIITERKMGCRCEPRLTIFKASVFLGGSLEKPDLGWLITIRREENQPILKIGCIFTTDRGEIWVEKDGKRESYNCITAVLFTYRPYLLDRAAIFFNHNGKPIFGVCCNGVFYPPKEIEKMVESIIY